MTRMQPASGRSGPAEQEGFLPAAPPGNSLTGGAPELSLARMKILCTVALAAGLFLAAPARADTKAEGFGELSVDEVAALAAAHGADIYDNDGKDDWRAGHVPGAKWVAFNQVKPQDLPGDHARKLVFYCFNRH